MGLRLDRTMQSVRWVFNTQKWQPTKEDWVVAAQRLQNEEKARIGKFVFKKDGKSSMVCTYKTVFPLYQGVSGKCTGTPT